MDNIATYKDMMFDDIEELLIVQKDCSIEGLGHIFPQQTNPFPTEQLRERWKDEIKDQNVGTYIANDKAGKIIGFGATKENEMLHFGVATQFWGSGLAREFHDWLLHKIETTTDGESTFFCLRVFEENYRARRFYEKLGWKNTEIKSQTDFAPYPVLIEYRLEM